MKRIVRYASCATLIVLTVTAVSQLVLAEVRTWTNVTGKYRIEAELVGGDAEKARLKRSDGRIIPVPLKMLCTSDRRFVQKWLADQEKGSGSVSRLPVDGDTVANIELVNGAKIKGRITNVSDDYVSVQVTIASRKYSRKYPVARIHTVTVGDRRIVFNESTGSRSGTSSAGTPGSTSVRRTRIEIDTLLDKMGQTPPDWWDSVPLNYPNGLDLSWPRKAPGDWNAHKNVGQYIWEIINPNPGKWKEGVRLVHHLLQMHQNDPEKRTRAMNSLGQMYYGFFQDYARAAFWWRKAGAERSRTSHSRYKLADCYFRLGNKRMALELLNQQPVYLSAIKLLADMGEIKRALQLAEAGTRTTTPDIALLYAGDACRLDGEYAKAIGYYQRVLAVPAPGTPRSQKRIQRNQSRARANIEGIKIFDALDLSRIPDGVYHGSSAGYAGQVKIEVAVRSGRIESVKVVSHKEKQFFSSLTDTPKQIIERQGVKGVDSVTGATITSEAIVNATARALAGAR